MAYVLKSFLTLLIIQLSHENAVYSNLQSSPLVSSHLSPSSPPDHSHVPSYSALDSTTLLQRHSAPAQHAASSHLSLTDLPHDSQVSLPHDPLIRSSHDALSVNNQLWPLSHDSVEDLSHNSQVRFLHSSPHSSRHNSLGPLVNDQLQQLPHGSHDSLSYLPHNSLHRHSNEPLLPLSHDSAHDLSRDSLVHILHAPLLTSQVPLVRDLLVSAVHNSVPHRSHDYLLHDSVRTSPNHLGPLEHDSQVSTGLRSSRNSVVSSVHDSLVPTGHNSVLRPSHNALAYDSPVSPGNNPLLRTSHDASIHDSQNEPLHVANDPSLQIELLRNQQVSSQSSNLPTPFQPSSSYYSSYYPTAPSGPAPLEDPHVFPKEFSFGVGSGAYHIEGAWDQDQCGESIWDRWLHSNPEVVADGSCGDYSADAYNHIKGDVEIFNNLTIRHYRFSISWKRIIPSGCGAVNPLGIDHYRQLINLLKINEIEPIVTIYHGDLPQALQDQGGFLSSSFVDWYLEYAKVLFEHFGNDVKYWITFNDPVSICKGGYGDGTFAPGYIEAPIKNAYTCGHNLLLAHAAAYHHYDDYYRSIQKGKISINLHSDWFEPARDCDSDRIAADIKRQFQIGWFGHPIYNGDYPEVLKERVALKSELELLNKSRLPAFTHSQIDYVKNTHDFFSLSYATVSYCTDVVEKVYYSESYFDDIGVQVATRQGDDSSGIRNLINWISVNYHNPAIFIVNNAYGNNNRNLNDWDRIEYLRRILTQIRLSQIQDNARVYGYTYYSYIDGFEWLAGYTQKYGLYDVDFSCPAKTRTPRESALYYQNLCQTGRI